MLLKNIGDLTLRALPASRRRLAVPRSCAREVILLPSVYTLPPSSYRVLPYSLVVPAYRMFALIIASGVRDAQATLTVSTEIVTYHRMNYDPLRTKLSD